MKLKYLAGIIVLAATPFAAQAATQASNFDYSHVEAGFADFDEESGLFVGGSYSFTSNIHAVASFYSLDNIDIMEVGAGYHTGFTNQLDGYAEVKLISLSSGPFDEDGLNVKGGARFAVQPNVEIGGGLSFYSFDNLDSETNLFVNGAFTFAKNLAVVAEFESGDVMDHLQVGVRYDF